MNLGRQIPSQILLCYRKFGDSMLQQLVNGLILGSVYALIALGYTMVYGIIKLINFAHGDLYMMGAFIGYYLINSFQLNFFLALILTMVLTACLGVLIEFLAYRPLRNSTKIAALITAIGVSFFPRIPAGRTRRMTIRMP